MEKKSVQIRNFGINFDLHHWDLPNETFTACDNIRIVDGKVIAANSPINIWAPEPATGATSIVYVQRGELHFYVVSGEHGSYCYDGNTWQDISSTDRAAAGSFSTNGPQWTSCRLGFNTIFNLPQHFPEYWSGNSGDKMKALPFSPTKTWKQMNYRAQVIRSHKDFLFALNLTENGVDFPYSYRWSHPADINGLPFTWDEMDLSAIASKESVGGDYGVIVDGLSLRDSFCIYTERAIHILDYIGDEFVFRRRLLSASHGLIAVNCVVEAVGRHYFITENDIIVNDGNSLASLLTGRLKSVFDNINQAYYKNSFVVVNPISTEIWFCIPETGWEYPSLAIVYNYVTETFATRKLISYNESAAVPLPYTALYHFDVFPFVEEVGNPNITTTNESQVLDATAPVFGTGSLTSANVSTRFVLTGPDTLGLNGIDFTFRFRWTPSASSLLTFIGIANIGANLVLYPGTGFIVEFSDFTSNIVPFSLVADTPVAFSIEHKTNTYRLYANGDKVLEVDTTAHPLVDTVVINHLINDIAAPRPKIDELMFLRGTALADGADSYTVELVPYGYVDPSTYAPTGLASIAFGALLPDPNPWDSQTTTWEAYSHTDKDGNVSDWWDYSSYSPFTNTFFGVAPMLFNIQKVDGARDHLVNGLHVKTLTTVLRDNVALEGHSNVTTLTRVYPHITSPGPVTFEFGSHDFNNSTIRWQAPVTFNPVTDRKIDIRTTGELQAWKISAEGYDFQLSGLDFEYTANGTR